MNKPRFLVALSAAVLSFITVPSHAALISVLGGQAYYDDVADLTWLQDANAAGTAMSLADSKAWAAGLNIDGVTGWRLPDTPQPDSSCSQQGGGGSWGASFDCTGSEMGDLFYNVLGGTAGQSIQDSNNGNLALFGNVQLAFYWSGTDGSILGSPDGAWIFDFNEGFQGCCGNNGQSPNVYAWAVHAGNVGEVPVPAAVWLFGSGLLGLIGVARRKKAA
jgi:hypothetical protein